MEAIQVDTLSLHASSIQITDIQPNTAQQHWLSTQYDLNTNQLRFRLDSNQLQIPPQIDSVRICYQVFPVNFAEMTYHRSLEAYDTGYYGIPEEETLPKEQAPLEKEEIFSSNQLYKTGSISRGISVGNSQDVVVNSALNLQLEGQLTEDIHLTAVINDQNVPFQPEGNTLHLQELDKVFVQLKHKHAELSAGDIVLKSDSSYFLKYLKNIQGGQAKVYLGQGGDFESTSSAAVSVAKGQFHIDNISPLEGVSGPYRLQGPNHESFLVVIANSEKVYLDGRQLTRGYQNDYTIDYNTAEITFTNQILITKFSRIKVEFEYAVQQYSRSIFQASHQQRLKNINTYVHFYQEKDNPNSSLLFSLSEADKQLLSDLGDNTTQAFSPAVDTLEEFDVNQILYTQKETLVDGEKRFYFEWAPKESAAPYYRVAFSEVGTNQGNYRLEQNTANGRVYRWHPPVDGIPQGNYAPVRLLVPPTKKQMVTTGVNIRLNKHHRVFVEGAFSEFDKNLFSSLDREDDRGMAIKGGYYAQNLPLSSGNTYRLDYGVDWEFNQESFTPIDRFRSIEYDRNWAIQQDSTGEDQILNAHIGLKKDSKNAVKYRFSIRDKQNVVSGTQHWAELKKSLGKFYLQSQAFLLKSEHPQVNSDWQRLQMQLAYQGNKFQPGYQYQLDKNSTRTIANDSIVNSLMNYEAHEWFIQNGDSTQNRYRIAYTLRDDYQPLEGQLSHSSHSQTVQANYAIQQTHQQLNFVFTYRLLENLSVAKQPDEETVMGRLDWNTSWLDKHIRSELSYASTSGRELKREYIFVKVEPGKGTHTWRDDNNDGIQDLNEFYPAVLPDEMNYAKFFLPSTEYINAFALNFQYKLYWEMPRGWKNQRGFKRFLQRFSMRSSVAVNKKVTSESIWTRILPWDTGISKEELLADQSVLRNTLFFNRKSPKFGMELRTLLARNKQLLSNGFENRSNREWLLNSRWNLTSVLFSGWELAEGSVENTSNFLTERNYQIQHYRLASEWAWQPNAYFRFSTTLEVKQKEDQSETEVPPEDALIKQMKFSLKWSKAVKRTINAQFNLIHIDYEGVVNSPVGYEILEALQPGTNFTWNLNWIQRLTNGLQLKVIYHGRKPPQQDSIHLGRMQVTALF
ncbi:hypothetical protein AAG747_01940 [Rapidithrix thailandica]|uniref:Uncharacterized protein n=1 Tax=Rapidithrix thailandica TaxID=413964 RepID=A0AAW9S2Q2_9BACT